MGIKCNPTINIISVKEIYKMLLNSINNLNLEKKLLIDKQKFIINWNNVSFIFSTTEIEKKNYLLILILLLYLLMNAKIYLKK